MIAYVNDVRSSGDQKEIPLQAHALIQLDVGQDVPRNRSPSHPDSEAFPVSVQLVSGREHLAEHVENAANPAEHAMAFEACCLAVKQPPHAGDDRHYHQQDEDAGRRRKRRATSAASTKADHRRIVLHATDHMPDRHPRQRPASGRATRPHASNGPVLAFLSGNARTDAWR